MRHESSRIPEQLAGKFHCFRDGRHRDFAALGPNDSFPGRAVGHLLQYLKDHDARALKSGFPMAYLRVGHDEFAKLHAVSFVVDPCSHAGPSHSGATVSFLQARALPPLPPLTPV